MPLLHKEQVSVIILEKYIFHRKVNFQILIIKIKNCNYLIFVLNEKIYCPLGEQKWHN